MTRMGVASIFRDALRKAQIYMKKKEEAGQDPAKLPPYDAKCEALIPVLTRQIPLKVHCEQFDMLTTIAVAKEFGCDYTIEHGWACNLYVDELVEGGGSVCFGPIGIAAGYGELTGGDVAYLKELDDRGRYMLLLNSMRGQTTRAAHFACAIACAFPGGDTLTAEGRCDGAIAFAPMGTGGFGYDPVFLVPEKGKTFGQLTAEEKSEISHRGKALKAFCEKLATYLGK